MAVYFFDTSAIVKRYIQEVGTAWVRNIANPASGNLIYLVNISIVEVASAVARRQRTGSIAAPDALAILTQYRKDLITDFRHIEITPVLISKAAFFAESFALRAYDAVQLAAAMELHTQRNANSLNPLTMVSADQELNTAAANIGLLVENPNLHP